LRIGDDHGPGRDGCADCGQKQPAQIQHDHGLLEGHFTSGITADRWVRLPRSRISIDDLPSRLTWSPAASTACAGA
jgi:hypothetical protein